MLTETEKNLMLTLDYFVRHGSGNTIPLTRRDVAIVVKMMERLDDERPPAVKGADAGGREPPRLVRMDHDACVVCGELFTLENPARFLLRGRGKVHAHCKARAVSP